MGLLPISNCPSIGLTVLLGCWLTTCDSECLTTDLVLLCGCWNGICDWGCATIGLVLLRCCWCGLFDSGYRCPTISLLLSPGCPPIGLTVSLGCWLMICDSGCPIIGVLLRCSCLSLPPWLLRCSSIWEPLTPPAWLDWLLTAFTDCTVACWVESGWGIEFSLFFPGRYLAFRVSLSSSSLFGAIAGLQEGSCISKSIDFASCFDVPAGISIDLREPYWSQDSILSSWSSNVGLILVIASTSIELQLESIPSAPPPVWRDLIGEEDERDWILFWLGVGESNALSSCELELSNRFCFNSQRFVCFWIVVDSPDFEMLGPPCPLVSPDSRVSFSVDKNGCFRSLRESVLLCEILWILVFDILPPLTMKCISFSSPLRVMSFFALLPDSL